MTPLLETLPTFALAPVFGALIAGFLGSPHCAGMCGGFAGAASLHADRRTTAASGAAWHLGRLTAYAGLGALTGSAGAARVLTSPVGGWITLVFLVPLALSLAGMKGGQLPPWFAPRLRAAVTNAYLPVAARLARHRGLPGRYAFGLATALLPCGLLWSGLALAAATGNAVAGAATMAVFFLGTLPALIAASAGLRRLATSRPWARRTVAFAVLAVGVWSISMRSGWLSQGGGPSLDATCHASP